MRMWMVSPKLMCNKHLIAEHCELHMFNGSIERGTSMRGYLSQNLLEPASIESRHTALVEEMLSRGISHFSPLIVSDKVKLLPDKRINRLRSNAELFYRCASCRERRDKGVWKNEE